MSKDKRLYGKFTHDFPDHPKIMPLSDAGFRCLVEATLWSCRHQTDGFLARRYALARWSLDALQELCTNDGANSSLVESDEGWLIRDFTEHQSSREDIEARRERNKLAGQKGGLAKAKRAAKRVASKSVSESVPEVRSKKQELTEVTTNVVTPVVTAAKPQKGTRINPDYLPPESLREAMSHELGVSREQLGREHRRFVDHWLAASGRTSTKRDWNAAWRNWMRNARDRGAFNVNGNGTKKSTSEQRYDAGTALIAMYADQVSSQPQLENNHYEQGEIA